MIDRRGQRQLTLLTRLGRAAARPYMLVALFGCVSLDQLPPGSIPDQKKITTSETKPYPDLDPGWTSVPTAHFTLKGYRESELRQLGVTMERIFSRISTDLGLYSSLSSSQLTLTVYRDRDEYEQKTKMPTTSRAATAGNGLYTYVGSGNEPQLAYELTSLVIEQHLGDKLEPFRWLQAGLAMNQELSEVSESERNAFVALQTNQLRKNRAPFSQMTFAVPTSKEGRRTELWYLQVESVVRFVMNQGSGLSFGGFLNSLKTGADIDQALTANYPGKFRNFIDLENAWKYTI